MGCSNKVQMGFMRGRPYDLHMHEYVRDWNRRHRPIGGVCCLRLLPHQYRHKLLMCVCGLHHLHHLNELAAIDEVHINRKEEGDKKVWILGKMDVFFLYLISLSRSTQLIHGS
jgi:hypothetical protein